MGAAEVGKEMDPDTFRNRWGLRGLAAVLASALAMLFSAPAPAQAQAQAELSEAELARQTQNPVADLISVPFQNNTSYEVGPRDRTQNVLNIQPVIPLHLSERWNLITRTILPVVSQPSFAPGQGRENGVGDVILSLFFSPKEMAVGRLIWGAGPVFNLPTASDRRLGVDEWGTGLTGVALMMAGPVVTGALVNNVWSLEGEDSSRFPVQPFFNYDLPGGWYLTSAPILTADW